MKLFVKQNPSFMGSGESFSVCDEHWLENFRIEAHLLSFPKRWDICSLHGEVLAYVQRKLFSVPPKFSVCVGEDEIAVVTYKGTNYEIAGPDWRVELRDGAYQILDGERRIAAVTSQGRLLGDAYEIFIADGEDPIKILPVALVIDTFVGRR